MIDFQSDAEYAEFERRCCDLFERIDAGEKINVVDAADYVGLPIADFIDCWNSYQAFERRKKLN